MPLETTMGGGGGAVGSGWPRKPVSLSAGIQKYAASVQAGVSLGREPAGMEGVCSPTWSPGSFL